MVILTSVGGSSVVQFITVLIIFVIVLALAYWTTTWIAGFQKERTSKGNIAVLETQKIANNKYIQIVRIGSRYFAMSVCKDTMTLISELDEQDISIEDISKEAFSFKDFLNKAKEQKKD